VQAAVTTAKPSTTRDPTPGLLAPGAANGELDPVQPSDQINLNIQTDNYNPPLQKPLHTGAEEFIPGNVHNLPTGKT
jgi:hypothetical protein